MLVEWFGKEELKHVVGGERWWQVRGLDGIESEWVTENRFLASGPSPDKVQEAAQQRGRKLTSEELNILRMDKLERVMVSCFAVARDLNSDVFWFSVIRSWRYVSLNHSCCHGRRQSRPLLQVDTFGDLSVSTRLK